MNYPSCPKCNSSYVKKNGTIYNKKQKYQCNTCKYQFVENPKNKQITEETKQFIDKLLLERFSLASIAHVTDASERWHFI